jgi:hypothetical protein
MPPLNRYEDNNLVVAVADHDSSTSSSTSTTTSLSLNGYYDHHHHPHCPPIDSPTSSCINLNDFDYSNDDAAKYANHDDDNNQSSSSDSSPKRSRKGVKFHDETSMQYSIPHHTEWTDEERTQRYYTQEEYFAFKSDVFTTLFYIRNYPHRLDNIQYTGRGVECRDPAVAKRRNQIKQVAWSTVFDEQKHQQQQTSNDTGDWMATMYSNAAKPALREALDLAAADESDVINFREQEETQDDAFSDDWISSILLSSSNLSSSTSTTTIKSSCGDNNQSSSEQQQQQKGNEDNGDDCGFVVFGEPSGFDDSWIRGD